MTENGHMGLDEKVLTAITAIREISKFIEKKKLRNLLGEIVEKGCEERPISELKEILDSKEIKKLQDSLYNERSRQRKTEFDKLVLSLKSIITNCKFGGQIAAVKEANKSLQLIENITRNEVEYDKDQKSMNRHFHDIAVYLREIKSFIPKTIERRTRAPSEPGTSFTVLATSQALVIAILLFFGGFTIYNYSHIIKINDFIANPHKIIKTDLEKEDGKIIPLLKKELEENYKIKDLIENTISKKIKDRFLEKDHKVKNPFFKGEIHTIDKRYINTELSSGGLYNPEDNSCMLNLAYDWRMSKRELNNYKGKIVEIISFIEMNNGVLVQFQKEFVRVNGFYNDKEHPKRIANVSDAIKRKMFPKNYLSISHGKINLNPVD